MIKNKAPYPSESIPTSSSEAIAVISMYIMKLKYLYVGGVPQILFKKITGNKLVYYF